MDSNNFRGCFSLSFRSLSLSDLSLSLISLFQISLSLSSLSLSPQQQSREWLFLEHSENWKINQQLLTCMKGFSKNMPHIHEVLEGEILNLTTNTKKQRKPSVNTKKIFKCWLYSNRGSIYIKVYNCFKDFLLISLFNWTAWAFVCLRRPGKILFAYSAHLYLEPKSIVICNICR